MNNIIQLIFIKKFFLKWKFCFEWKIKIISIDSKYIKQQLTFTYVPLIA
jgi:hypothetical protein